MRVLHIDFETRSLVPLDRVSTHRYASDETTEVLCAAYAIDDGPIGLWTPDTPVVDDLADAIADPAVRIAAHNAVFEYFILRSLWTAYQRPSISINRFACTMSMARACALPGSLDGAAAALGLEVRKNKADEKLMREIATRKREHPTMEELEGLYTYCKRDVEIERELFRRLPQLIEAEQDLWILDHQINQRGIPIDRQLAIAIDKLTSKQRININAEIAALTGGKVTSANQRDRIIAHLAANGCKLNGLTKTSVNKALANGLDHDHDARKLLELRSIGSQAAASKVGTLLTGLDSDERLRETLVFHGSATGRWAGRKFQPHNLKKANRSLDADTAIAAIMSGELAGVAALGQPLSIASDVMRGLICARPGNALIGADFSAIESRVLAWLANEKWKLTSYAQFDETGDPALEPYCLTASKILKRTVTPDDEEARAVGKVADLACGFGGGVGAWRKFSKDPRSDEEIKADIGTWRNAHPRIKRFWADLMTALKRAVRRPGKLFLCGRIAAECRDGTLWMTLPSGRAIAYPQARLVNGKFEDTADIAFKDNAHGKWTDTTEWYGTFVENAVQGTARDLLAAALIRLEAAGFPIIAHVHDEAVAEIPGGEDRRDEFLKTMTTAPAWADGLPIAGKPWMGPRYLKSPTQAPEAKPMLDRDVSQPRSQPSVAPAAPPWEGKNYSSARAMGGSFDTAYIYRNAQGQNYLKVEKRGGGKRGKEFRQWRWTGTSWESGKPAGPKIPYRLPELIAASPDEIVHIAEGEKDTETLASLGLIATTNAEGAKKGSWTVELNQWFVGRKRVCIPEDNDEPGRAFAREKAKALEGIVPDIRIVSFPDLPEHGDVTDWIKLGHTKEEYLARCDAAPQWKATELKSVRISDISIAGITWWWPGRFARGKLGLVVGLPDEGKGQLLCYLAARVTTEGLWPMNEGRALLGNVIYIQCEDGPRDTIKPRLLAAGADPARVFLIETVVEGGKERMFSLQTDLEFLRKKIIEIGDVVLVLIDPIHAYLGVGKIDSYRSADVRAVLGPLTIMLEEMNLSAIGIMHFNKKSDVTNALLRISDSLAYAAVARHVYAAIDDKENGRKLLVRAKNNLSRSDNDRTLAYRFDEKYVGDDPKTGAPIRAPFVKFDAEYVDVTATEAMHAAAENKSPGARDEAKTLLRDLLAGGQMPQAEIEKLAKAEGIAMKTLRRAKKELGIKSVRDGDSWAWKMATAAQDAQGGKSGHLGHFDGGG